MERGPAPLSQMERNDHDTSPPVFVLPEYKLVTAAPDGDRYFFLSDSVKLVDDKIVFLMGVSYGAPRDGAVYLIANAVLDPVANKLRLVAGKQYSADGHAAGSVGGTDWTPVEADGAHRTMAEAVLEYCAKNGIEVPAVERRKKFRAEILYLLAGAAFWLYTYLSGPVAWLPWHYSFFKPGFEYVASSPKQGYAYYYAPGTVRAVGDAIAFDLGVAYGDPRDGIKYQVYEINLLIPDKRMMATAGVSYGEDGWYRTWAPPFPWRDIAAKTAADKVRERIAEHCAEKGIPVKVPVLLYNPAEWRYITQSGRSTAYFRPASVKDAGDHIAVEVLEVSRPEDQPERYNVFYRQIKFTEGKWRLDHWRKFDHNFRQTDYLTGTEWHNMATSADWVSSHNEAVRTYCRENGIPLR